LRPPTTPFVNIYAIVCTGSQNNQQALMNYLLQLFFSDHSEEALLGSLLGDFVKGNPAGRFSAGVSDAILLHRKVDSFSDAHPNPAPQPQTHQPRAGSLLRGLATSVAGARRGKKTGRSQPAFCQPVSSCMNG
jgi:hypothetical protein